MDGRPICRGAAASVAPRKAPCGSVQACIIGYPFKGTNRRTIGLGIRSNEKKPQRPELPAEAKPMASAPAAGWEHVSPPPDGTVKPLHFFKVAPVSCPIAASVVCAAFNPSRKPLSEYAEYLSVAPWSHSTMSCWTIPSHNGHTTVSG
jgi:hypothetical protein